MSPTFKKYLIDTLERVICTFAEAFLGVICACSTLGEVNWGLAFSTAGLAALISLLKCIIARTSGDGDTASLVK